MILTIIGVVIMYLLQLGYVLSPALPGMFCNYRNIEENSGEKKHNSHQDLNPNGIMSKRGGDDLTSFKVVAILITN